jgi:hypothetical protein
MMTRKMPYDEASSSEIQKRFENLLKKQGMHTQPLHPPVN